LSITNILKKLGNNPGIYRFTLIQVAVVFHILYPIIDWNGRSAVLVWGVMYAVFGCYVLSGFISKLAVIR